MSRTDLVADVLTAIRNALKVGKEEVVVPYSKVVEGILKILKEEKYINNFKVFEIKGLQKMKVYLRYDGKKSVIKEIKKVSRPGRRIYVSKENIPQVCSGYGIAVISTSSGIISDREARKRGTGGELLCYVW